MVEEKAKFGERKWMAVRARIELVEGASYSSAKYAFEAGRPIITVNPEMIAYCQKNGRLRVEVLEEGWAVFISCDPRGHWRRDLGRSAEEPDDDQGENEQ